MPPSLGVLECLGHDNTLQVVLRAFLFDHRRKGLAGLTIWS